MNILVLNYEYPPLGGGAGVVTQNISQKLADFGHQVTVVSTWFPGEQDREERGNLKVIRLRSQRRYTYRSSVFEMLSWIKKSKYFLGDYCREGAFDICLSNFSIPGGEVAIYLKKKFNLKYALLSHGHDIPWMFSEQMFFFHLLLYFKIRKVCRESQINVVFTDEMKMNIDRFIGSAGAHKNMIISNGVNFERFKPDYSRRGECFKILFVGRLVPQKDPLTFLKAIKLYSKKNRNISVNVMGDGVLRSEMESFIMKNDMTGFVRMLGWLPADQVIPEYQSAHVHVAPSVYEAMSVSMLESLACGCFLITTPLSGIRDLLSQKTNVAEVAFRSPEQISEALDRYYQDKFMCGFRTGTDTMDAFRSKYNWETLVRRYEKCFSDSLQQ